VDFADSLDKMYVHLNNQLVFIIPTQSFNGLKNANKSSLNNYKLIAGNTGIYWPDLDEDLSLKGFLKDYLKQKVHTEKELTIS